MVTKAIAEQIAEYVQSLIIQLRESVEKAHDFLAHLTQHPDSFDGAAGVHYSNLVADCSEQCSILLGYELSFPQVTDEVLQADERLDRLGTLFERLGRGNLVDLTEVAAAMALAVPVEEEAEVAAPKEISTREAMELYSRSRSTIYRWIKSGKLNAIKRDRRWVILLS